MKISSILSGGLFLLVLFSTGEHVGGAKILSIAFFHTRSHYLTYEHLLVELAKRGHEVTIANPIPSFHKPHPNIRRIYTYDSDNLIQTAMSPMIYQGKAQSSSWSQYLMCPYLGFYPVVEKVCEEAYKSKEVQELRKEKFDLIFFAPLWNDCVYGLLHEWNTTTVLYNEMAIMPWVSTTFGSPSLPSFIPMVYYDFTDQMTFWQRTVNFLGVVFYNAVRTYYYEPGMEKLYRSVLGQHIPRIQDIQRNASLTLINSNINFVPPRPLTPDVIEVGGLYLKDPRPLPKDLQEFCDGAKDGVILFSFGSILKSNVMPEKTRDILLKVFSQLKQRVLFKWEDDTIKNVPANVRLSKWLPQPDILGHKNTRLFITHGGHGSTSESLYAGVPMLGIPMFAEQQWNIEMAVAKGYAVALEFMAITETTLKQSIEEVLNNPKYREKAKLAEKLYKDQVTGPLERAVYWVEYALRYQGAPHLRSVARDLSFAQYYSLDVISFLAAIIISFLVVVFLSIRLLFKLICAGDSKKSKKKVEKRKKTQ